MAKVWEVIVERKITNRFTVEARTRSEAAAVVGMALGRDDPWGESEEIELSRRLIDPKSVAVAGQEALDFDALRRGETPPDGPTDDEIAAARAQRNEDGTVRAHSNKFDPKN